MWGHPSFSLKSRGVGPLLFATLFLALAGFVFTPAEAVDDSLGPQDGIEAPSDDIEPPAQIAPDDAEAPSEGDVIEPGEPVEPKVLDRSFMRPDLKQGEEGARPPLSAEENKQDKLTLPPAKNLPLPLPVEKPKALAELYQQLGAAPDIEAARPIMESIEHLWRLSGSDTVDLLMSRTERFAKAADLDLALKISDATVDMAPDAAEAWHLRAKVHFLKKEYELATADLRRALARDPKHYAALNDLGVALEAVGAKKEALEIYRKALAINPFLDDTKRRVEELSREVEGQDI